MSVVLGLKELFQKLPKWHTYSARLTSSLRNYETNLKQILMSKKVLVQVKTSIESKLLNINFYSKKFSLLMKKLL